MTDIRQIEPYGFTFYENREMPLNVRMAMASRETAKHCSLRISDNFICYASSGNAHVRHGLQFRQRGLGQR